MFLFMCTNEALTIVDVLKRILNVVQIGLIILLIIYCTIDVAKIVVSKKDDDIKAYRTSLYNRILSCILIFLIPSLIFLIFGSILSDNTYDINEIKDCWYKDKV